MELISLRETADHTRRLAKQLERRIGGGKGDSFPRPAADPSRYLRWLEAKTARIDIRGLAMGRSAAHLPDRRAVYTADERRRPLALLR